MTTASSPAPRPRRGGPSVPALGRTHGLPARGARRRARRGPLLRARALLLVAAVASAALAQAQTQTPPPAAPAEPAAPADPATPLTFEQALQLARQGPTVALAAAALEQASAQLDASFGNVSGTLKGGVSQTWGTANGSSIDGGGFDPITLNATLNVVPYGPAWDAHQGAARAVESARLALADATAKATSDAASAYLAALRASQQVELDARAVAAAKQRQTFTEAQAARGDASQASLLAARLATTQAQTTEADDRLTQQAALDDLAAVLGRPVAGVAGEPPATRDPPTDDVDGALARRSDVRSAELAVQAAVAGRTSAVRGVLPSAQLSARLAGGNGDSGWSAGLGYDTTSFQPSVNASVTPPSGSSQTVDGTSFSVSLGVSVPLDTAVAPALHAVEVSVSSSTTRLEQTKTAARQAISAARRALATRQAAAALKHEQAAQQAALADQADQRLALGLVAAADVDDARLAADQATLAAQQADDAVLLGRMALAVALGLDPMEVF